MNLHTAIASIPSKTPDSKSEHGSITTIRTDLINHSNTSHLTYITNTYATKQHNKQKSCPNLKGAQQV
jgi:hypothetical protein